jgi:hypothetical protein
MARHEADREDLWAEAVAMTSRVELSVEGQSAPVLVGYRGNGWCSIYFGQDEMWQFTTDGELRRGFRHGDLFRSQGTTLARLQRRRSPEETTLLRHDLTPAELAEFQQETHDRMRQLQEAISSGRVVVRREIHAGPGSLLERISATLNVILQAGRFLAPGIPGKT